MYFCCCIQFECNQTILMGFQHQEIWKFASPRYNADVVYNSARITLVVQTVNNCVIHILCVVFISFMNNETLFVNSWCFQLFYDVHFFRHFITH